MSQRDAALGSWPAGHWDDMRSSIRKVALVYAAIVGAATLWAWCMDVKLLHSVREHLAPDILLGIVSFPSSLSIEPLYDRWPAFFRAPFMELAWLTVCGALQVAVLYSLSFLATKKHGQS